MICLNSLSFCSRASGGQEDHEFVRQLMRRDLPELAERYCEHRIAAALNSNDQAEWEAVLADCRMHHAWQLHTVDRNSLAIHSAERITGFLTGDGLKGQPLEPVTELMLRLRQQELLLLIPRAAWIISRSTSPVGMMPLAQPASQSHVFLLKLLSEVDTHTEALLIQVNQVRRHLTGPENRSITDRARLVLGECRMLQSVWTQEESVRQTAANSADELLQQLSRSAGDESIRFLTRCLLAESRLLKGELTDAHLRIQDASGLVKTAEDRAVCEGLEIRVLLREAKPTDALMRFKESSEAGIPGTPELLVLQLECLQSILETLDILGTGDSASQRRKEAEADFIRQQGVADRMLRGVWQEAGQAVNLRFRNLQRYGILVSRVLNEADRLRSDGQHAAALAWIEQQQSALPSAIPAYGAATLQLRTGQLNIAMENWQEAISALQNSCTSFETAGDQSAAAGADLLKVYSLGKQWESGVAPAAQRLYESALIEHTRRFAQEQTAATARDWLNRLHRYSSPLLAIEELIASPESAPPEKRFEALQEAGHLLAESARTMDVASSEFQELKRVYSVFEQAFREFQNDPQTQAAADGFKFLMLRLDVLELSSVMLATQPTHETAEWETIYASIVDLELQCKQYPDISAVADRIAMLRIVATVRCGRDSNSLAGSAEHLLTVDNDEKRLQRAAFLARYLSGTIQHPGDVYLAGMMTRLLGPVVSRRGGKKSLIPLLQMAGAAEVRTGSYKMTTALVEEFLITSGQLADSGKLADVDEVAAVLIRLTESSQTSSRAVAQNAPSSQNDNDSAEASFLATVRRFWKRILKQSQQGDDRWLEASLQSAMLAQRAGDAAAAIRILDVTEVLYPTWGSAERLQRVQQLRAQKESSAK
jgi:hypothetical protein